MWNHHHRPMSSNPCDDSRDTCPRKASGAMTWRRNDSSPTCSNTSQRCSGRRLPWESVNISESLSEGIQGVNWSVSFLALSMVERVALFLCGLYLGDGEIESVALTVDGDRGPSRRTVHLSQSALRAHRLPCLGRNSAIVIGRGRPSSCVRCRSARARTFGAKKFHRAVFRRRFPGSKMEPKNGPRQHLFLSCGPKNWTVFRAQKQDRERARNRAGNGGGG